MPLIHRKQVSQKVKYKVTVPLRIRHREAGAAGTCEWTGWASCCLFAPGADFGQPTQKPRYASSVGNSKSEPFQKAKKVIQARQSAKISMRHANYAINHLMRYGQIIETIFCFAKSSSDNVVIHTLECCLIYRHWFYVSASIRNLENCKTFHYSRQQFFGTDAK